MDRREEREPGGTGDSLLLVEEGGRGFFLLGGGDKFNLGWLKIILDFDWESCMFFGTVLGRRSSLFQLAMLDAYG